MAQLGPEASPVEGVPLTLFIHSSALACVTSGPVQSSPVHLSDASITLVPPRAGLFYWLLGEASCSSGHCQA